LRNTKPFSKPLATPFLRRPHMVRKYGRNVEGHADKPRLSLLGECPE
jgi:hypothetical protein